MNWRNNFPLEQLPMAGPEPGVTEPLPITTVGVYGGYYQPCGPELYAARVDAVMSKIEAGMPGNITISEYQAWGQLDWLLPQGTYEAGRRLALKWYEEGGTEYVQSLSPMPEPSDSSATMPDTSHSNDELGDAMYCALASASNIGADVETLIARKLQVAPPVTLDMLDALVSESNPLWMPLWLDVDPADVDTSMADRDELDPEVIMPLLSLQAAGMQFSIFHDDPSVRDRLGRTPFQAAADWHADAVLIQAYMLRRWTRATMGQAAAVNIAKIQRRVAMMQVDKHLGTRPTDGQSDQSPR